LNLSSQQKRKDKQSSTTTKKANKDDISITPECSNDKGTLDKKTEKKISKFSIVNLLFNR